MRDLTEPRKFKYHNFINKNNYDTNNFYNLMVQLYIATKIIFPLIKLIGGSEDVLDKYLKKINDCKLLFRDDLQRPVFYEIFKDLISSKDSLSQLNLKFLVEQKVDGKRLLDDKISNLIGVAISKFMNFILTNNDGAKENIEKYIDPIFEKIFGMNSGALMFSGIEVLDSLDVSKLNSESINALYESVISGYYGLLKKLASIPTVDSQYGMQKLLNRIFECKSNKMKMVVLNSEKFKDIKTYIDDKNIKLNFNAKDKDGQTMLHYYISTLNLNRNDSMDTIKWLLEG